MPAPRLPAIGGRRLELKKAFEAVEAVLLDHDAELLVDANAALRETDDKIGSKKLQQRPTKG